MDLLLLMLVGWEMFRGNMTLEQKAIRGRDRGQYKSSRQNSTKELKWSSVTGEIILTLLRNEWTAESFKVITKIGLSEEKASSI